MQTALGVCSIRGFALFYVDSYYEPTIVINIIMDSLGLI